MMLKAAEAALHVTACRSPRHRGGPFEGARYAAGQQAGRHRPRHRRGGRPKTAAEARRAPASAEAGVGDLVEAARQHVVVRANPLDRVAHALGTPWRLPHRPLPDGTVNTAPEDAPTSGRFSTDESVAIRRRFQRRFARSSHGLCSPSRFPRLPPATAMCSALPNCPRAGCWSAPRAVTAASSGGTLRAIPLAVALRRSPA
jgi:hypothetical protein